ncbi:hypothetical protein PHMEG_00010841 [Phytophthora megakarya]|uniref:Uncharacterized protein n=1 Tax=Phytophthora megakarya TaxID=4795 RepID=A0A225WEE1_9STRA|nr:hypothetical protein PHMEG_00010841 [Phytophthora megakarya]
MVYDCLISGDDPEVIEWVPEHDRVWFIVETLSHEVMHGGILVKMVWVLDNLEFREVRSRIAIRNAMKTASNDDVRYLEQNVQNTEVRKWCFGSK